jgi:hypothetical protein
MRTGLHQQFPANREINREFRHFDRFEGNFAAESPCAAAVSREIPYDN